MGSNSYTRHINTTIMYNDSVSERSLSGVSAMGISMYFRESVERSDHTCTFFVFFYALPPYYDLSKHFGTIH